MDNQLNSNEEYIEIDLKEYLYILFKNRYLIIGIIILSILGGFLTSKYLMTNIYSTEAIVRLTNLESSIYSSVDGSGRIIKSRSFIENVNEYYNMNLDNDYIGRLLSDQNNLMTITGNNENPFIVIKIKGEDPEQIQNLTNNIANYFIIDAKKEIIDKKQVMKEHIDALEQEKDNITDLQENINILTKNLSEDDNQNQFEINYVQNTLIDIKKSINEYSIETTNQIYEIKGNLTNISSPRIVSAAELPDNPVEPNIKLNMAIAFVLGIFLAVFIVFIKQFLKGTDWSKYEDK